MTPPGSPPQMWGVMLTQSTPGTERALDQPTLEVTSHRVRTMKQTMQPNPSHQRHVARKQARASCPGAWKHWPWQQAVWPRKGTWAGCHWTPGCCRALCGRLLALTYLHRQVHWEGHAVVVSRLQPQAPRAWTAAQVLGPAGT